MGKKKNILTEDLFNSNGNSNVSSELLNESTTMTDNITEEIKDEEVNESDNEEIVDESLSINENLIERDEETIESDNEEIVDEENDKKEKEKVIKTISKNIKNKIGFNDESYYYDDYK